ncbi:MAG TPA: MotA/TolQ/ExbB proton channel family protein [Spirochaetota bacterium]|nr:MotA/TolQ/ExbB proton channel family protein [Spirochaetota bacterium]
MSFSFITNGGIMMYLIIAASITGLYIILERFFYFRRIRINAGDLLHKVKQTLGSHPTTAQAQSALNIVKNINSPLAVMFTVIINNHSRSKEEIEAELEIAAKKEVPKLEQLLSGLNTVGTITPLMGLLGTVIGMISSFSVIASISNPEAAAANVSSASVANGISTALYTTAAGLFVALPCMIFYNYFNKKKETIINEMEQCSAELISHLKSNEF